MDSEFKRSESSAKVRGKLFLARAQKKLLSELLMNGAQGRPLPAIRGLRGTGASLHNGIEPPTRGFSIPDVCLQVYDME